MPRRAARRREAGRPMDSLLGGLIGAASLALAINIGANNSAAEMGPAFGAGVRSRLQALFLIAVFCTSGAILAGERVVHNVGYGLLKGEGLAGDLAGPLVVIIAATGLIALANLLRAPLSTAHVVVGAIVGLGFCYGTANLTLAGKMVVWWVATPLAALALSYLAGRKLYPLVITWLGRLGRDQTVMRTMAWLLTLSGCWMAFSAGSNSLAKAMGPAVGAEVLAPSQAAVMGGLGMALGALLLGGRVLNTVGKEITKLCPVCAMLVELISASIIFAASRFGMPVSLTEIVTCSVIGFSCAANGLRGTSRNQHVRRILLLWPGAPAAAGLLAFLLQHAVAGGVLPYSGVR